MLLIGQLAVHVECQGQGLVKTTLIRALWHCLEINTHLPSFAVIVDVLEDEVQTFYKHYGFHLLDVYNERKRLYLAISTVNQVFKQD